MKPTLKTLSGFALAIAVFALVAAAPAPDKKAVIGEAAPNFTLKDMSGKKHKLSDFRGKIVVLEWTNPNCPIIVKCYKGKVVNRTITKMKEMGDKYVYLAVNSTGIIPEQEVISGNQEFLKTHELSDIPVLIDHDGTVGRMFGARTTPHMFVIDDKGVLRYQGAYTDDPSGKKPDSTNYVLNALNQIKAGETVSPDNVRPWGCGVKYKK